MKGWRSNSEACGRFSTCLEENVRTFVRVNALKIAGIGKCLDIGMV
jgi:hypothetical protein